MPYKNEHSFRIGRPARFKRFRRINNEFGDGIDVIYGVNVYGRTEVQAIRFKKDKWTYQDALHWIVRHGYQPISKEKAVNNPRRKFTPPYRVSTWFERDRAAIEVYDANDNEVASWWDEDVQEMFEGGFFVSGRGEKALESSVIKYLQDMKVIGSSVRNNPRDFEDEVHQYIVERWNGGTFKELQRELINHFLRDITVVELFEYLKNYKKLYDKTFELE